MSALIQTGAANIATCIVVFIVFCIVEEMVNFEKPPRPRHSKGSKL